MVEKFKNFKNWVIYQIYPRSFFDTNGDGKYTLTDLTILAKTYGGDILG